MALNYLKYMAFIPNPPDGFTLAEVKFTDAEFARLNRLGDAIYNASNPDLHAFAADGGKLILYHGWADDSISPTGTIAYYTALQQRMGGLDATQQFARLFMFPGVYHCSGGEGPSHWDMVAPITDWVEGGVAPTEIVATQYESDVSTAGGGFENPTDVSPSPSPSAAPSSSSPPSPGPSQPAATRSDDAPGGRVTRTLPAFAYPLQPQYTGVGDVNDAESYRPVLPATPTRDDVDWIGRSLLGP
jgi:feruloyl esterase